MLRGVDLAIETDEFVAVMGPSGSGKTTLLNLLGLLDAPDAGTISIDGDDVSGLSDDERSDRRARTIGMVFQDAALLPPLTVAENVTFPLHIGRWPRQEHSARVAAALEAVGLGGFGTRRRRTGPTERRHTALPVDDDGPEVDGMGGINGGDKCRFGDRSRQR